MVYGPERSSTKIKTRESVRRRLGDTLGEEFRGSPGLSSFGV